MKSHNFKQILAFVILALMILLIFPLFLIVKLISCIKNFLWRKK